MLEQLCNGPLLVLMITGSEGEYGHIYAYLCVFMYTYIYSTLPYFINFTLYILKLFHSTKILDIHA
jgi:hypothetical protein